MINVFQPSLGEEELRALSEVFRSNWLGKGKSVQAFTEDFARSLMADPQHFITTTCCTEGLFLAGELFGIEAGDEVIAPTISFIAVGNSIVSRQANMVLCDVDPRSLNLTAEHLEPKLTAKTKAVFINHYGGVPCEMDPILDLCRARGVTVIEDSACAVRSFYKGKAAGTMGDMGVWSFDAMKALCAGDGGMLYLKDAEKLREAQEALYMGLPASQKSGLDGSSTGKAAWWEVDIRRPGRRAIMNNITGAIALTQLGKLAGFMARRHAIYSIYMQELGNIEGLVLPPRVPEYMESSNYFFWVQLDKRDELAKYLLENGVYSTFRYWPLHKVEYFRYPDRNYPNANKACQETLCLPLHQALSDEDVFKVIDLVRRFFREKI